MKKNLVRFNGYITPEQKAKLKKEQNGSQIVREALDNYYKKRKK